MLTGMSESPASWHPDPMGRHQLRYWDGKVWTDHVSNNGVQATDALQPRGLDKVDSALTIGNEGDPTKIQQQLHGESKYRSANVGEAAFVGGGTIFTEPILVVNQKAKLIELNNQYSVFDQSGGQIASVQRGRPERGEEGRAPADQLRPVHDPPAGDRRHCRSACCWSSPGRRS